MHPEDPEDHHEHAIASWLDGDLGGTRTLKEMGTTPDSALKGNGASGKSGTYLASPAPVEQDKPAKTSQPASQESQDQNSEVYFPVRLDRVDNTGAYFKFDSLLLHESDFRACLPRQCVICGSHDGLEVHTVFRASKVSGRNQHAPHHHIDNGVELAALGNPGTAELLAKLPPTGNMAEPFCLPMPYYVCKNCNAAGAVTVNVQKSEDGMSEICELGFASLGAAENFACAVGADNETRSRIKNARKKTGDSWRLMPLAVRIRINQWFKPENGEQFISYIPDADLSPCENGLAGVVITDKRLVYHKAPNSIEMPHTEKIAMQHASCDKNLLVKITSTCGKTATLKAEEASLNKLQNLLSQYGRYIPA